MMLMMIVMMNFHLGCCPERWVYLFHLFYYSIIDCLPRHKREVAGRRLLFYAGIESTSAVPQVAHMQVTPRAVLSSEYVFTTTSSHVYCFLLTSCIY